MILDYGLSYGDSHWDVTEKEATGFLRVYYIYGGEVVYTDDNTTFELLKGHLYLFSSTRPYKMRHNPQRPINHLHVHLEIPYNVLNETLDLRIEKDTFLFDFLSALKHPVKERNLDLVCDMMTVFKSYCVENKILEYHPSDIADILTYMLENFRNDIDLECLSKKAGYSIGGFIRRFKQHCGISPYQHLNNLRFNAAINELKNNKSISEAAYSAGYSDVQNFSRAFKQKYGASANKWQSHVSPFILY